MEFKWNRININDVSPYKSSSVTTSKLRVLLDNSNLLRLKEKIFQTSAKPKRKSSTQLEAGIKYSQIYSQLQVFLLKRSS